MKKLMLAVAGSALLAWSHQAASAAWWPFGKKKAKEAAEEKAPEGRARPDPYEEDAPAPEAGAPPAQEPAEPGGPIGPQPPVAGELPKEVVIKAEEGPGKISAAKPPIALEVDPFESIRDSFKPDEALLLAVSPMTVSWRRTHPEFLKNPRAVQPWRMTFSPRPGVVFKPREELYKVLRRRPEDKETDDYAWSLTIADEDGRVFHHYEGSDDPPEELVWSGQNEQGEWIQAGRAYSAVYTFTDPGGSPHTGVAKPLLFKGIVHQEESGLHISLDATVLFGGTKSSAEVAGPAGTDLLRSAADLIKRRYAGIPISIRVLSATPELGNGQGKAITNFLVKELMISPKMIAVSAARASFSEQRVEIVLLNR